jgi:hypothetical protein
MVEIFWRLFIPHESPSKSSVSKSNCKKFKWSMTKFVFSSKGVRTINTHMNLYLFIRFSYNLNTYERIYKLDDFPEELWNIAELIIQMKW